uniref:Poly(A) polymerase catalytic subunit domain-containing protein n=1 Tax=viral metagenome TaxID=1070528 RepID=A0A6C0BT71_9ZZZZ
MRRYRKKSIKLTDKSSKATNHNRTKKSMRDDTIDEKDEVITSKKYVNCKSKDFGECELEILRNAVNNIENKKGEEVTNTPEVKQIIQIVEDFIKDNNLVCYGGTAINNILPKRDQFYNFDIEMPDYDFFSSNAMNDAKKLADLYKKKGYDEVLATAGTHYGTFKVFVNFIPVADITQMSHEVFDVIQKESIRVAQIRYTPPNFLRMLMYLEISRPGGDVSRWEKVQKRLNALNKNYPLKLRSCVKKTLQPGFKFTKDKALKIHKCIRDAVTDNGFVFFGGYATYLYSRYMSDKIKTKFDREQSQFDILAKDIHRAAILVKERLMDKYIYEKNIKIIEHPPVGSITLQIVPEHIEIKVHNQTVCIIFKPVNCHSYNEIEVDKVKYKIATIDTMLSFFLSFIYSKRDYFNRDRILCMADFLYNVQQKNRLSQKGILKRFNIDCYGKGVTKEDIRQEKSDAFQKLKSKQNTDEYDRWFLKYRPSGDNVEDTEWKKYTEKELLSMLKNAQKNKNAENDKKDKNTTKKRRKKSKKSKNTRKFILF